MKIPLGLCLSLVTLLGCAEGPATEGPGPEGDRSVSSAATARGPEPAVVARVNGVAITEIDLDLKLKSDNHEAAPGPERRKVALEQLVTREILAQKALAQGLDRDPKYLEGQRVRAAQMAAYERQELAELLLRREGDKRGVPTEADARAYFDQYGSRVRSRVHVLQILRRTEAAIVEARSAIERGKPFEEVAKDLFPGLPAGQAPWDLGFLAFQQVPEPWRETVYDMKPGEMSGILRGPNDRFWLVKLVEVREDPNVTFESAKDLILTDLRANKVQRSREELEKELRQGARVETLLPP